MAIRPAPLYVKSKVLKLCEQKITVVKICQITVQIKQGPEYHKTIKLGHEALGLRSLHPGTANVAKHIGEFTAIYTSTSQDHKAVLTPVLDQVAECI